MWGYAAQALASLVPLKLSVLLQGTTPGMAEVLLTLWGLKLPFPALQHKPALNQL